MQSPLPLKERGGRVRFLVVRDREHGIEGNYQAMQQNGVHELRPVVTTEDYDRALYFYRDVLG
jgi:hypothetical protein